MWSRSISKIRTVAPVNFVTEQLTQFTSQQVYGNGVAFFSAESAPSGPKQSSPEPLGSRAAFNHFAELYLGGLWNKFESELRTQVGERFDYDVHYRSGCMKVTLPDKGTVVICKHPRDESLLVESNLRTIQDESADPRDAAEFRLSEQGDFTNGQRPLHRYLEEHFSQHLKVDLHLEPQPKK